MTNYFIPRSDKHCLNPVYHGSLLSDWLDLDKQQVPEEDGHDDKNAAI